MAKGYKTGGRKAGTPNKVNADAVESAREAGEMPLDYMLRVMRDPKADSKRRDVMANAAAPYLHQKLVPADKATVEIGTTSPDGHVVKHQVTFVVPGRE